MSPQRPRIVVSELQAGSRLDLLVRDLDQVGSRRRARQAIETGKISLDGRRCGAADIGLAVGAGAVVELDWGRPGSSVARHRAKRVLQEAGLQLLYEDPWLVAVDKPAGLLSDTVGRRQAGRDSLRRRLARYLRTQGESLQLVHRIDRDTSGVVLAARDPMAAKDLKRQFRQQRPERVYWVAVQGVPPEHEGPFEDWMAWDQSRLKQRLVPAESAGAVLARAHFRLLRRFGQRAAILQVRLVTGRRNQIRLHCQLRGYPLFGERQYLPEDWPADALEAPRQALHASSLSVLHPSRRRPIRFEAPLPPDLVALERRLQRRFGGSPQSASKRRP